MTRLQEERADQKQILALEMLLPEIYERLGVKLRRHNETVAHATYTTRNIMTPKQFAAYEGALKAIFVHTFLGLSLRGADAGELWGCLGYHKRLAEGNRIELPFVKEEWDQEECDQAARDYDVCSDWLRLHEGVDAHTGEKRGLYHATLD